jgi:hypothetical protein
VTRLRFSVCVRAPGAYRKRQLDARKYLPVRCKAIPKWKSLGEAAKRSFLESGTDLQNEAVAVPEEGAFS